jgi:hypothetical protein
MTYLHKSTSEITVDPISILAKEGERQVEKVMLSKFGHKNVQDLYREGNIPHDTDLRHYQLSGV